MKFSIFSKIIEREVGARPTCTGVFSCTSPCGWCLLSLAVGVSWLNKCYFSYTKKSKKILLET
jgi:hypothetical protein